MANKLSVDVITPLFVREGKTLDNIMDAATTASQELDAILTLVKTHLDGHETSNYTVNSVSILMWKTTLAYKVSCAKLFVALLCAWDLIFDKAYAGPDQKKNRKDAAAELKPDLVSNCDADKSFPSSVMMVLDQWVQLGRPDLALKAVANA